MTAAANSDEETLLPARFDRSHDLRRRPVTTYRLQFQSRFTLADACEVLPYLAALGVTDCYSSPLFQARPGSTHGYDVAEHDRISAELGGEEAFAAFAMALSTAGLGHVLDIVPNHMSNDPDTNPWWRDVLENGPSSPFADYFDIDWDPVKPELHNRLLVPTLRTQYGEALESGELQLVLEEATLALRHGEQCLPINPRQAPVVFGHDLDRLTARLPDDDPHLREFLSILTALRNLPAYTERDPDQVVERQREKRVARERLARLLDESAEIRGHMDAVLARFNGVVGEPASFDLLHELLEGQAYRLASWRTASDEINYRRFFDINELAGLRVERPEVFDHTHAFVLGLVRQGLVTGLRIDHVDGLFDPAGYLDRLQQEARRPHDADPTPGGLYVVVEKILATGESLPATWATHGTTGYDFMNDVLGIFVDTRNRAAMRRVYERFTNERSAFADLTYESKQLIALTSLAGELNLLAHALNRISERNRRTRDFTLNSCHKALLEVVSCFPVYRTYVGPDGATASDQEIVDMALASARRRNPAMESSIFDFVRSALVPPPAHLTDQQPADEGRETERISFAMKFQQYTAPVQAKGVEDTAFYRYHVLTALNEVGGEPDAFGRSLEEFHAANLRRRAEQPLGLAATATHDTKRGEDTRARIAVLSELPDEWRRTISRWARTNAANRTLVHGLPAPDRGDEYLFYQSLVGIWPSDLDGTGAGTTAPPELIERLCQYMTKATKEAKVHTSWITPSAAYDDAVTTFVRQTLAGRRAPIFLASFVPFARTVARLGAVNALAQLVLKTVAPGVSDFYQGTELWDLTLVDPDNRQPIDFGHRRTLLAALEPWLADMRVDGAGPADPRGLIEAVRTLFDGWTDGRVKLALTACAGRARRARPDLFLDGEYLALAADGAQAPHVVACARQHRAEAIVAVVSRWNHGLTSAARPWPIGEETWTDTRVDVPPTLAGRTLRNLLTGERFAPTGGDRPSLAVGDLLRHCPIALLWAEPGGNRVS